MEKHKVALIWPDFNFYHVARFRALYERLKDDLLGIELIGGEGEDESTQWRYTNRENLPIVTLFPNANMKDLSRTNLGKAAIKMLEENKVNAVFVNGYGTRELRMIIDWSYRRQVKCFTFSESKRNDFIRFFLIEWFKKNIVKKLSGAICGGKLQKEYLIELGIPAEKIFLKYDVVDNKFFKERSFLARKNAHINRKKYKLAEKYFITASRMVKKKNLSGLISGYKKYREKLKGKIPWELVLCGSGSDEEKLKEKVANEKIEGVVFAGPKPPEELSIYYALASCFVLASTREQWALAVNEAMACALPTLVTKIAGAANELIEEDINGYTFNPFDIDELSEKMIKIHELSGEKRIKMGLDAQKKIMLYSPTHFAESIIKAINLK